jgi:hypothetical protein
MDSDSPIGRANLNLIAAAPALYEALKAIAERMFPELGQAHIYSQNGSGQSPARPRQSTRRAMNRLVTADARTTSPVDFLRALQGKPPLTDADRAEKQRQADEFWAERRKQNRADLEQHPRQPVRSGIAGTRC